MIPDQAYDKLAGAAKLRTLIIHEAYLYGVEVLQQSARCARSRPSSRSRAVIAQVVMASRLLEL